MNADHANAFHHDHFFLGARHARNEARTWSVIALCGLMMLAEIVGGSLFGSLALVADGLHMSTHAGALLLAALAYRYARRHRQDARFAFGTGKLGDLAGFTSAIVLAMISLLIGYEAVLRFISPVAIHFREAVPIAAVGLLVNIASAWLLNDDHHHDHPQLAQGDDDEHGDHDHEAEDAAHHHHHHHAHRDNNLRAAFVHVLADAAVSVLVIAGLLAARFFGWLWMDPLAGVIGAVVIASWAFGLVRDTGSVLLDMNPDQHMTASLRRVVEADGDRLADLHLWRLGPGHFGVILSIVTGYDRGADFYRARLARFRSLSHLTIEVHFRRETAPRPMGVA